MMNDVKLNIELNICAVLSLGCYFNFDNKLDLDLERLISRELIEELVRALLIVYIGTWFPCERLSLVQACMTRRSVVG